MKRKCMNLFAMATAVLLASALLVNAAGVPVANYSFEDPEVNGGTNGPIPNWSESGEATASGVFDIFSSDGDQAAWLNGPDASKPKGPASFYQDVGLVITEGWIYTLTVDVGQRSEWPAGGATIQFYGSDLGLDLIFAETVDILPGQGEWLTDQTLQFHSLSWQDTGQTLGIALIASGGVQCAFDNVRLDAVVGFEGDINEDGSVDGVDLNILLSDFEPEGSGSTGSAPYNADALEILLENFGRTDIGDSASAVPEPTSLSLLGVGSVMLLLLRRRRV